ncbi:MAG: hypothetical protein PVJ76_19550 [Gemmatimonadota bacterium]|jgi:hypothetical protein
MRRFQDDSGAPWEAYVRERAGDDYKGRFWFVMVPEGGAERDEVELIDVRWNSRKTAERTLETMSEWELRRRLRSARGRAA